VPLAATDSGSGYLKAGDRPSDLLWDARRACTRRVASSKPGICQASVPHARGGRPAPTVRPLDRRAAGHGRRPAQRLPIPGGDRTADRGTGSHGYRRGGPCPLRPRLLRALPAAAHRGTAVAQPHHRTPAADLRSVSGRNASNLIPSAPRRGCCCWRPSWPSWHSTCDTRTRARVTNLVASYILGFCERRQAVMLTQPAIPRTQEVQMPYQSPADFCAEYAEFHKGARTLVYSAAGPY
jgi:hypothetical protein